MTTETRNSHETAVATGRPFLPGQSGNPNGRPKKGNAIRDLLKSVPIAKKRELVQVAYREAIENGDVHWAEWIARHSGESGSNEKGGDTYIQQAILVRYIEGG